MITDAQLDAAIRSTLRASSALDRETMLMVMAQAATCSLSEREQRESLARVRRNLLTSLAVFAEHGA